MWVSGHNLSSVETTPEQRSPRSAFPPCWEPGIIGGRKSKPPSGKKRQPNDLCLEATIWKQWVNFAERRPLDLLRRWKFQSMDQDSRLHFASLAITFLDSSVILQEGAGFWSMGDDWCLTGLSSVIAFPFILGQRATW